MSQTLKKISLLVANKKLDIFSSSLFIYPLQMHYIKATMNECENKREENEIENDMKRFSFSIITDVDEKVLCICQYLISMTFWQSWKKI